MLVSFIWLLIPFKYLALYIPVVLPSLNKLPGPLHDRENLLQFL